MDNKKIYDKGYEDGYRDGINTGIRHKISGDILKTDNDIKTIESIFMERRKEGIYIRGREQIIERFNKWKKDKLLSPKEK